jgi:aminobenzoyl-glutamate utilization protein B
MTTLDLLTKPQLRKAARDYFTGVQTKDQKYVPVITKADKPAVEINSEVMARYKPELSKYYYDPSRYPTYLDQLGIKFPTLEGPQQPAAARP